MQQHQPFLIRHADLIFAFKTFAASVLALLVAFWLDLPRPYWAMATVYITSQPLAGATRSKAFYRVVGTVIGAAATVVLVPNLINSPEILSFAIALWLALCLYLSLLDRRPHSYVFMLAGYTAAFIGFPAVSDPGSIFDTAVARTEEITLGIVCATLVSTLIFPRSIVPIVAARVDGWLGDAQKIARDMLAAGAAHGKPVDWLRLASDGIEIDMLSSHLAYDRSRDVNIVRGLQMLRLHMLMLLPLLVSVCDRLVVLGDGFLERHPDLARLFEELSQWIVADADQRLPAEQIRTRLTAHQPRLDPASSWEQIMTASLLIRLRDLVDLSQDCRNLSHAVRTGDNVSRIKLAFHPDNGATLVRHRDHGLALWSAAGAAFIILACCSFWIATGWVDGGSAPMIAAVACSFFAGQDDPIPSIVTMGRWTAVSVVVAAVYLFAIIPAISDIEMLIAALAPTFVLFGVLIARPKTAGIGLSLGVFSATLLALQSAYGADFISYANSSLAILFGMAMAAIGTKLVRSIEVEWMARRLMKTNWSILAAVAKRRGRHDRAAFAGLLLDRLGLLVQRLALIPEPDRVDVENLSQLRVGLNVIDLRRTKHDIHEATLNAIDEMLERLAIAARDHVSGPMPSDLLALIDTAISQALKESSVHARENALIGLTGIRRGLFPTAGDYSSEPRHLMRLAS